MSVKRFCILFLLQGFCASPIAFSQSQGHSINELFSAPLVQQLVASPKEARFAWLREQSGTLSIESARKTDFKVNRLAVFAGDQGLVITIHGFTYDGKTLIFSKSAPGNAAVNSQGPPPSATYGLSIATSKIIEIAPVTSVAISPVANEIAYVLGDRVLSRKLSDEEPKQEAVVKNADSNLVYSPDGNSFLLQSKHYKEGVSYAFILLYKRDQKVLRYLDPSVYWDQDPSFSPDGSKVAFIRRMVTRQSNLAKKRPYPKPEPWQIRVVDISNRNDRTQAKAEHVWRSKPDSSFYNVSMKWYDDEHIAFVAEENQWSQLFIWYFQGGEAKSLTPTQSEVNMILPNADKGIIVFTSNGADLDRRQISYVEPPLKNENQGEAKNHLLSNGRVNDSYPVFSEDGNYLAFIRSEDQEPSRPVVMNWKDKSIETMGSQEGWAYGADMVIPEKVVITSLDGLEFHGQLFLPPNSFTGKRPAVIYLHGGPSAQFLMGWNPDYYVFHLNYAMLQYFASQGIVGLAVNYRMSSGYGKDFREIPLGGARGAIEYLDILASARFLRQHERINGDAIGIWGQSYGATLTGFAISRNSDIFAAGVEYSPMHDWMPWIRWSDRQQGNNDWQFWDGEQGMQPLDYYHDPLPDRYSSFHATHTHLSPVMIIASGNDTSIPFSQSVSFLRKLEGMNHKTQIEIYPNEGHNFFVFQNWIDSFEKAFAFFDNHLKPVP